jgi:hypothetical protein
MIQAPHPALRRLYALGSAPALTLSALGAGGAALQALTQDLSALPLLSGAALAALAAALDLSRVDAALGGMSGGTATQESTGLPGGARDTGRPGAPSSVDRPQPAPAFLAPPPGRGVGPGDLPEVTPAAAGGLRTPGRILERLPDQVQKVLERYAPAGKERPPTSAPSRRGERAERSRRHAGGDAAVRRWEAAALPGQDAARPSGHPRPRAGSGSGVRTSTRRLEDAAGILVRRAARAGSPQAATTRVGGVPAATEIETILARGVPGAPGVGGMAASRPEADAARGAERAGAPPPAGLSQLARSVARLTHGSRRPGNPSAPPATASSAGPGPEARREGPGGLRGLLERVAPAEAEGATPARRAAPREGVPDLLAERRQDALLADRLAAILRREAMRQGIDLERVD